MCNDDKNKQLNDDDLWNRAGSAQKITRVDIGIDNNNIKNGLESLNEGFNFGDENKQD